MWHLYLSSFKGSLSGKPERATHMKRKGVETRTVDRGGLGLNAASKENGLREVYLDGTLRVGEGGKTRHRKPFNGMTHREAT